MNFNEIFNRILSRAAKVNEKHETLLKTPVQQNSNETKEQKEQAVKDPVETILENLEISLTPEEENMLSSMSGKEIIAHIIHSQWGQFQEYPFVRAVSVQRLIDAIHVRPQRLSK